MEMRVGSKRSVHVYISAACALLSGSCCEASPITTDELHIVGLGPAVQVVGAVVSQLVQRELGDVTKLETGYTEVNDNGRPVAKLSAKVQRRKGSYTVPLIRTYLNTKLISPRSVHVWLPEDYSTSNDSYSVLYMHDGQNVFEDERAAFGTSWGASHALSELMREGAVRKTIIVAIFNGELARFREYVPAPVVDRLEPELQQKLLEQPEYNGSVISKEYLRFIVEELKPEVDKKYRTRAKRDDTFIMGSSMGGLISLHAMLSYPDVFGAAGCVSTHWPLTLNNTMLETDSWRGAVTTAFRSYLEELVPGPGSHRFWFDHGDTQLDAFYQPYQLAADAVFKAKGYMDGKDVSSKAYPGTGHNEAAWRDRLREPLTFLLGK